MTLDLELAPQQQQAIDAVARWLEDPFGGGTSREPGVFRLFGYAGTGKTSVARLFAQHVEGQVRFACFTGKAALVMQRKGCLGASTIHRLIYLPRIKCAQRLRDLAEKLRAEKDEDRRRELSRLHEEEKQNLARPAFTLNTESDLRDAALLVIDECSMVGNQIGQDLLSFKVPILALGDPAQLPPVKDRGFFTDPRQVPDFLLTEIHRQAAGSPVLRLATDAREGRESPYGDYEWDSFGGRRLAPDEVVCNIPLLPSRVVRRRDLAIAEAAEFSQVIVGRNETRRQVNARIREVRGLRGPLPVPGDRVVCRRNDYETGLLNGSLWKVLDCVAIDEDRCYVTLQDVDSPVSAITVEAHRAPFEGKDVPFFERMEAQHLEFGWAITCHLSQGSQWRDVCVVDESACFGADRWRWVYTSITRASERVTVVR